MSKARRLEINFPVPVEIGDCAFREIVDAVSDICDAYERAHPDRLMWPAGMGAKPTYIPMTAEEEKTRGIEFSDDVQEIECFERERFPEDRQLPEDRITEIHNRDSGRILRKIVEPTIAAGGQPASVMVLLESVVLGVLLAVAPKGAEEATLDAMVTAVKKRLAKARLKDLLAAAKPMGRA